MNCFQFCIFAVWNTTLLVKACRNHLLWIAFNFVSLQCETQLAKPAVSDIIRCELLSILYLCSVKHNLTSSINATGLVVNCFQFCIFAVWNTTQQYKASQHSCCELLSILYLCSVKHNERRRGEELAPVVNCFQFCIFAVWNTTFEVFYNVTTMLWIAFNFVSLQCETQQIVYTLSANKSCELLSILYLCSVKHNSRAGELLPSVVVNCFQFCIFAVWNTTTYRKIFGDWKLWIAFNFVSLQCETQRIYRLFKFSYVVNCFQFCIFAVWNTTYYLCISHCQSLWIAFNFVSLQCETQLLPICPHIQCSCELLSILYLCSVKHNIPHCKDFIFSSLQTIVQC